MAKTGLQTALPELAREIEALLIGDGRLILADQINQLEIVDRCSCDELGCATFYTVPCPEGAWGIGHESIVLDAEKGLMVLDLVNGKIVCVEILDRADISEKLRICFSEER